MCFQRALIRFPRAAMALVLAACLVMSGLSTASARSLIRDAEIEYALEVLAQPLVAAAGMETTPRILVVNDLALNAFVTDGRAVFIHAGLLLRLERAEDLQAVIAHELAHITNGHITRRGLNAQRAQVGSALGVALGVAAAVAAGDSRVGIGVAAGSSGAARGVFFAHTREEEAAADRSGMRFLARAGIDPVAMARVMTVFAGQEDPLSGQPDPYTQSHPLSRDRLRAIRAYAEVLGPATSNAEAAAYWHGRARAKLSAYLRDPDYTFRIYPTSNQTDAAQIARSVAHSKLAQDDKALAELDALLAEAEQDAFAWDLKGWVAMEANRPATAVAAYEKAVALAPREPQILAGLGRALLAQNTRRADTRALDVLKEARLRDGRDPGLLRSLAQAHARLGNNAMASLHTAERFALLGDARAAAVHAKRAAGGLPAGSPARRRAEDILDAATRAAQTKR